MADILCPNCNKNNPDFLDVCQFCQTPLKPEAMVHTGESPTKKHTGELEPILPDWLRDIRQQSKVSTDEDNAKAAAFPSKVQKNEPPDLLAGLASQSGSADEDEVPDWLANLNPVIKPTPSAQPSAPEPETDFFAQFNKSKPQAQAADSLEETSKANKAAGTSAEKDELSEWFSQTSQQPAETVPVESDDSRIEMGWMDNFESPASSAQEAPKEAEDLSWLRDLEASAKGTGELSTSKPNIPEAPQEDLSWLNELGGGSIPAQPAAPKEDLSWLDNLGGTSQPSTPPPASEDLSWLRDSGKTAEPSQPTASAPKEDLDWLNNLGGPSEPQSTTLPEPTSPQEDLSWLNNLGGTPLPSQPAEPRDDLSWLNDLGESGSSTPAQASAPQEDLSWLKDLGGTSEELTSATEEASKPQEDFCWLKDLGETQEP